MAHSTPFFNVKLRSHFEPTKKTHISPSWVNNGCLSWVIWRKVTARYRERIVTTSSPGGRLTSSMGTGKWVLGMGPHVYGDQLLPVKFFYWARLGCVCRWKQYEWASYKIRKIAGTHALGTQVTFSPPPGASDSDMHHGTCVTHVVRCMPGSLTSGSPLESSTRENVPGIPGACEIPNVTYLVRGPWG